MGWLSRRHRKKHEENESVEFKEPKKSILRSKGHDTQLSMDSFTDCDSEISMVDLRNTTVSGTRFRGLNQSRANSRLQSTQSLRSLDGSRDSERSRRSVLFLDEVMTRKKQQVDEHSIGSPSSVRTGTPTGAQFSTFASYPASYQPSPVMQKRDADSGIELISRSPLPRVRTQSEYPNETWSARSSIKESVHHFSLTGRRRKKKQLCYDSTNGMTTPTNGTNQEPLTRLDASRTTFDSSSVMTNRSNLSGAEKPQVSPSMPGSGRSALNGTSSSLSQSSSSSSRKARADNEDPMIKRPTYPRIIETRCKPSVTEEYKRNEDQSNHNIVLVGGDISLTDSNVTLRPDGASSTSLDTLAERSRKDSLSTSDRVHGSLVTTSPRPPSSQAVPIENARNAKLPPPVPRRQTSYTQTVKPAYRTITLVHPVTHSSQLNSVTHNKVINKPPLHSERTKRLEGCDPRTPSQIVLIKNPSTVERTDSQLYPTGPSSRPLNRVISITR